MHWLPWPMFNVKSCGPEKCCDTEDFGCEFGDSDFPALPIFGDESVLEATTLSGGICIGCDERFADGVPSTSASREQLLKESSSVAWEAQQRLRLAAAPGATSLQAPLLKKGDQVFGSPACLYQGDPADILDAALVRCVRILDPYAKATLILRRVEPGKYEIDGRLCELCLGGPTGTEIQVREDGCNAELSLPAYLSSAANVAVALSRPPGAQERRPSFTGTNLDAAGNLQDENIEGHVRTHSMQVACLQAKIREQAQNSGPVVRRQCSALVVRRTSASTNGSMTPRSMGGC